MNDTIYIWLWPFYEQHYLDLIVSFVTFFINDTI